MKKIVLCIITAALFSLSLIGCSGTEVLEDKPKKVSPITELENTVTSLNNSEEATGEEPEEIPDETPNVLGNGTAFVKVGDRVFFREYDADAMDQSYMWGDIHGTVPDKGIRYIKCFDAATGNVEKLFEDEGYGDLSYYNGVFYLNGVDGLYTINEDGSDKGIFEFPDENAYFEKIVGNILFYTKYVDGPSDLKYINLDNGETGNVCPIPEESELGYPEIGQITVCGDDVYVGISYYGGTGHFHQGGSIYKASLSGAYETELLKGMSSGEREEYVYPKSDGSLDYGVHEPQSAYMDEADIWVCREDGSTECICKDYLKGKRGLIKDYVEKLSYLDGSVYLINNTMIYHKEDDIGWREAYKVFKSANVRINESGVINEFNIVKSKPEEIYAFVYYLHENDENGATQILYQPKLLVYKDDREMCERLGLDPDNQDLFMENFTYANPYYDEGFLGTLAENLSFKGIDYDSPDGYKSGGMDDFITKLLEDEYDMYSMLSLTDLQHDEYMDYYIFPEQDYTDENAKYYNNIFAKITFAEDGRSIIKIEEVYLP